MALYFSTCCSFFSHLFWQHYRKELHDGSRQHSQELEYLDILKKFAALVTDASMAVDTAIDIGVALGVIASLFALHSMTKAFLTAGLEWRKGDKGGYGEMQHFSLKHLPKFVGCMLSTCFVGFFMVTFLGFIFA